MNQTLAPRLRDLLAAGVPVVLAEVAVAKGSTPREAGAAMLVTADACLGTIGGGRLEWEATARARGCWPRVRHPACWSCRSARPWGSAAAAM